MCLRLGREPLEVDRIHQLAKGLDYGAAAAPKAVQRRAPVVPAIIPAITCSQRHEIYDDSCKIKNLTFPKMAAALRLDIFTFAQG